MSAGPMSDGLIEVLLHEVAHARAGDKGNRSNISVVPYLDDALPFLEEQLTEARIQDAFCHKGATGVRRYVLPLLGAMNFVIDDALEGGVNSSLNLDGHGKALSYLMLSIPVRVPPHLVPRHNRGPEGK